VQGTLDLLLLKIVALEPMNGWSISLRLRQIPATCCRSAMVSLYPALHKLEQERLDHGRMAAQRKQSPR